MKKIIFLVLVTVFLAAGVYAQENIEAPVWNVGDKWAFTRGNIEVVGVDQNNYIFNFSKDTAILENAGFERIVFEKSTLKRIYTLKGTKQEHYTQRQSRILNFPLYPGKQWQDTFWGTVLTGPWAYQWRNEYSESFIVLGWENVQVRAGKFRVLKLEYKQKIVNQGAPMYGLEGWSRYWYSPDVKYFVKCQYDKDFYAGEKDWELTSFQLKK
jgi:hypothetical protein